jgi:hypothetical protein
MAPNLSRKNKTNNDNQVKLSYRIVEPAHLTFRNSTIHIQTCSIHANFNILYDFGGMAPKVTFVL